MALGSHGAQYAFLAGQLLLRQFLLPGSCAAEYAPVDPKQIKDLLSQMTLQEKLETTGIPTVAEGDFFKVAVPPWDFPKLPPTPWPESWFDLKDHERLGMRGMRTRDGPRGITCLLGGSMRFNKPCPRNGSSPSFPHGNLRSATWSPELEEEFGRATGEIARNLDIHAALLPCINIAAWLNGGRTQESYGEDPFLNGKMGAATVRGVQSQGVMATPKHFLANNIENTRWAVSANMDDKTLHEVYLKKWAIVVADSSPEFIMTSYNRVQGNWSNIDPKFIQLLREKLGFQGSIMTDWLATMSFGPKMVQGSPFHNQTGFFGDVNNVLVAGVDMEMPFNSQHMLAARRMASCSGTSAQTCTTANMLDRAVAHLLRSKIRYGLATTPSSTPAPRKQEVAVYDTDKYDALSLKIARQGIVLLKNEGSFLPKRPDTVKSVVVLGTPAVLELGDMGSSAQTPAGQYITVLQGLKRKYGDHAVRHLPRNQARSEAVKNADLVVLDVGLNYTLEGEYIPPGIGGDRWFLRLPYTDSQLVWDCASVTSNIAVVMSAGASVIVEDFVDKVKAILWFGYPGAMGGQALADILAGDINPAGRMTSSTPRDKNDWVEGGITKTPYEGAELQYPYAHGFKHMWEDGIKPRYPLGWGLSYTTFSVGAPAVAGASSTTTLLPEVSVEVKNTGHVGGIETIQVYVTCPECKHKRLPILLVGFARVELGPGESKVVSTTVSAKEFAIYDTAAGMWLLEKGTYRLLVGPYASADKLQAVLYEVAADVVFDYAGAQTPPHVPGVGERDCSPEKYQCVPDDEFNQAWMIKITLARISWGTLLLLLLLLPWCICRRCRRCVKFTKVSDTSSTKPKKPKKA